MTSPGNVAEGVAKSAKNVPPMVWVIAVVGGLAVSYYMSRRGTSSQDVDTSQPFAVTYTGTGGGNNTGSDNAPVSGPKNNEEWAILAKRHLIARGYESYAVDVAVNKYVAGQPLNAAENAMIGIAIQGVGPTPQVLPPVTSPGDVKLTAPKNLISPDQGSHYIDLEWDVVPGAEDYTVTQTSPFGSKEVTTRGTVIDGRVRYTDSGLMSGVSHQYLVSANAGSNHGPSSMVTAVTTEADPKV